MKMRVVTYEVRVSYSYDEEDLPNLSMLTLRNLKYRVEAALEVMRKEDFLGTDEVTANWIEME